MKRKSVFINNVTVFLGNKYFTKSYGRWGGEQGNNSLMWTEGIKYHNKNVSFTKLTYQVTPVLSMLRIGK